MEHFYDKMKSVYEVEKELVPDDYSWDAMKEGINDRLDDSKKFLPLKRKKRYRIFGLVFLVGIIGFLAFFLVRKIHFNNNEDQHETAKSGHIVVSKFHDPDSENPVKKDLDFNKDQNDLTANHDKPTSSTFKTLTTPANNNSKQNSEKANQKSLAQQILNSQNRAKDKNVSSPDINKSHNSKSVLFTAKTEHNRISELTNIERLNRTVLLLKSERFPVQTRPDFSKLSTPPELCDLHNTQQLGVKFGTMLLSSFYHGNAEMSSLRNKYNTMILGQNMSIAYRKPVFKNYNASVALGLSNLNEELDIQFDKNATILVKDALVRVDKNIITSRKTYYRKDTVVGAVERRRVRQNNNFRLISIETAIGRTWCINDRWFTSLDLGVKYNRMIFQSGIQLGEGFEIIDFSKTQPFFVDNSIAFTLDWRMYYKISGNYYIGTDIQVSQAISNWSINPGTKNHPATYALNLGVLYSF